MTLRSRFFAFALCATAPGMIAAQECTDTMAVLCEGDTITECAADGSLWDYVPTDCWADFETAIEMEREFFEEQAMDDSGILARGLSWGGHLREGPGQGYGSLGTLAEGAYLEIYEGTGTWTEGYEWFYVGSDLGTGYHWGGIICTEGGVMDGVYSAC